MSSPSHSVDVEREGEAQSTRLRKSVADIGNLPNPQMNPDHAQVMEHQGQVSELDPQTQQRDSAHRSTRERKLTGKAQQNLEEEISRRTRRVNSAYERWRETASKIRRCPLSTQTLGQLSEMQVNLNKRHDEVLQSYDELRRLVAPSKEVVMEVDNCAEISGTLDQILTTRRLEEPEEFDVEHERGQTRGMKHAHPSIFGESTSDQRSRQSSVGTGRSSVYSLRVRAEAGLAEERERLKALEEEQSQRVKLLHLQTNLEEERMKLESIQAQTNVRAAEARSRVLEEASDDGSIEARERLRRNMPSNMNPLAPTFQPATPHRSHIRNDVHPTTQTTAFVDEVPHVEQGEHNILGHHHSRRGT